MASSDDPTREIGTSKRGRCVQRPTDPRVVDASLAGSRLAVDLRAAAASAYATSWTLCLQPHSVLLNSIASQSIAMHPPTTPCSFCRRRCITMSDFCIHLGIHTYKHMHTRLVKFKPRR